MIVLIIVQVPIIFRLFKKKISVLYKNARLDQGLVFDDEVAA